MSNIDLQNLVNKFISNGGKVKVLTPSRKRFKTWNGKSGAWNRGAKKIGLQDRNFQS
jgi:hypothetical protein